VKVVAFNGSPRPEGNTHILLSTALAALEATGIETELVSLAGKNLQGCTACRLCQQNQDRRCAVTSDDANACHEKLLAADGVLIGSPVHFADLTPVTKALIDRAGYVSRANGDLLRRKVGAAVVAVRRAGGVHTFDSINHFFLISQMIVPGASYWNIGVGREKGEVEKDEEGVRTMTALGENMAWVMKKLA